MPGPRLNGFSIAMRVQPASRQAVRAGILSRSRRTRSEVFRAALKEWLTRARWLDLAKRDRDGYTENPITPAEFEDLIDAQPWLNREGKRGR